jgi:hypothetical protein
VAEFRQIKLLDKDIDRFAMIAPALQDKLCDRAFSRDQSFLFVTPFPRARKRSA